MLAAGEVAFHYNERAARHERQETWFHAAAHGEHVGRSMIAPGAQYREIGSFWTDQYEISLQSVGLAFGEHDVVRGDISGPRFIVFHLVGDVIVGASAINAVSDLRQAKALIVSGAKVDAKRLADPTIKVSAAALL